MSEILRDVGKHIGTWGDGHYESWIDNGGVIVIVTKFDDPKKKGGFTMTLSSAEWDRLVAWIEWQRKKSIV